MKFFKQSRYYAVAPLAAAAMAVSNSASAAIAEADLTTAMTAITTDAQTVFDAVLPILITVLALVIGMKLVKRFTNKI
jgi:hypothetical protein